MATLLLGLGQYGPLAIALGLYGLMARAMFRGDLVPRKAVEAMAEAWKADRELRNQADALREAARKEEREQLVMLMNELRSALQANRSAA